MNEKYEKLKTLLRELFQLDQPDLDFGIYRIMHARAAEITSFLDKDLLPQVRQAFAIYKASDKTELEKDLAKAIQQASDLGADPDTMPKVKELRARLSGATVDVDALESEVYDHLFSFFRRYYSEGDFLSKRVYKAGVYAIPYEGEEVALHWANKDQYYIKTSEYLRDYAFRLRPESQTDPMRVHFRLVDVAEGEHDNVKAAEGKDRVFILSAQDFMAEEVGAPGKELAIRFEYRPASLTDWPEAEREGKTKPPAQKDLTSLATRRILSTASATLIPWIVDLGKSHLLSNNTEATYSRLEAHLRRYTARNTFDYFIHKDLGTFLRRELDFYIKNEVMHLDDVESETAPRVEQYLSKIKVVRRIAGKIIDFLAQLEDFQKKLWLKKKFVVETQYCLTLGCIPEAFYAEIAANDAQHQEWVRLFAINEIKGDLLTPGYNKQLTPEFLKAYPTLVVDTRHFAADFTARLLEAMGDMDDRTDGVVVRSDNYQALSLMRARNRGQVRSIYIDPPYNTGNDQFIFKDRYQHSSWLAMMDDRLRLATDWMRDNSALFVSIDGNERDRLKKLADLVVGEERYLNTFVWINNLKGRQISERGAAGTHEYVLAYGGDGCGTFSASVGKFKSLMPSTYKGFDYETEKDNLGTYVSKNELYNTNSKFNEETRPNLVFNIYYCPATGDIKFSNTGDEAKLAGYTKIPPKQNNDGVHKYHAWRWSREKIAAESFNLKFVSSGGQLRIYTKVRDFEVTVLKDTITDISTSVGTEELSSLMGIVPFKDYPKPVSLVEVFAAQSGPADVILDFFAGSGTTGHAVINLNREDGGHRKFILVEMADYFDTVLVPRIKKVTYTPEWKDGKPDRLAKAEEATRSPRVMKVLRLESYEDTLNNLETRRTTAQQSLLELPEAQGVGGLREEYLLRYMLDVETLGSQSLLNIESFADPTAYQLKVKRPGSDESRLVNVDLLETFNWLVGFTVQHIAAPRTFSAEYERDSENRLRLKGRLRQAADGPWWFRTVTGTTPDGRKTLVIWRKFTGDPEQDNLVLDEWFTRQGYSSKDSEFDLIYVNGGNNLENLKTPDDTWKVRLIEEDFHRLMFDTEGM
jgi:adenine-specific DNA-methyltransferase